jgi:glycosyltransferase involved in cell wall biosynthesis
VWILPTERENFSVAVLEALAAGCAVLATNCPGNDEVLVDHENAICFAIGDVDCAANGLQRLLRDPSLRQRIQVGARGTAESYRLDTMVQGYLDVYARSGPLAWLRPVVG